MKLIIQIPCLNEEKTLPGSIADLPKKIDGIDEIEILIIDDGSSDRTSAVAAELGVDHIVRNKNNKGLAKSFRIGLENCLKNGADIIVNTDGDNQYAGADIPKLIEPILKGQADIVIGDRQTDSIPHFSGTKKLLQRFGSSIVARLAETEVPDTVSGFRAFNRDAAINLNVVSPFSYTVETLIQAGKKQMAITSVPIATNPKTRESRLFKSLSSFIGNQLSTIIRMYTMYQPLRVFFYIGVLISAIGTLPILRFLYFYAIGDGGGHVQSLILGGTMVILGFLCFLMALLADVVSSNRQLIEMSLEKIKRIELHLLSQDDDKTKTSK